MKGRGRVVTRPAVWSAEGADPLPGIPLLRHLESLLPADGRGPLASGGYPLPDEPPPSPDTVRWGAALDGILSLRGGGRSTGDAPLLAAAAIIEACRLPLHTVIVHTVAERLSGLSGPSDMDRLLEAVLADRQIDRSRLAELARWLCRFGTKRSQVQAGIALLGISGVPRDRALIARLGLLGVLTLYAVVALSTLLDEPETAIFTLARQVDGWGRIHAVHRLKRSTDPAVRDWLLRGGYDSGVMVEELAYIAATTGGLIAALQDEADDELLDHAGVLLDALATGGPAEDMSDYAGGELAMELYFQHMASASTTATLARLGNLETLARYLDGWAVRNPRLSDHARGRLRQMLDAVLERPDWRRVVEAALVSDDIEDVHCVVRLAPRFGLDPLPAVRSWLLRKPHDSFLWQALLDGADREQLRALIGLAETLLPFDALLDGPELDLGLGPGPGYEANSCFEFIVSALGRFPGEGWDVIKRGLGNRVIRVRNMAFRVFEAWPAEQWPPDAQELLLDLSRREPDAELRRRMRSAAGG